MQGPSRTWLVTMEFADLLETTRRSVLAAVRDFSQSYVTATGLTGSLAENILRGKYAGLQSSITGEALVELLRKYFAAHDTLGIVYAMLALYKKYPKGSEFADTVGAVFREFGVVPGTLPWMLRTVLLAPVTDFCKTFDVEAACEYVLAFAHKQKVSNRYLEAEIVMNVARACGEKDAFTQTVIADMFRALFRMKPNERSYHNSMLELFTSEYFYLLEDPAFRKDVNKHVIAHPDDPATVHFLERLASSKPALYPRFWRNAVVQVLHAKQLPSSDVLELNAEQLSVVFYDYIKRRNKESEEFWGRVNKQLVKERSKNPTGYLYRLLARAKQLQTAMDTSLFNHGVRPAVPVPEHHVAPQWGD